MIKSVVKSIFQSAGLNISRLPKQSQPVPVSDTLRFGPYAIRSSNEALHYSYSTYPETNQVITRLVAALTAGGQRASMVDIGANCGDSAALAKCGGPVAVLCVEGDPGLCETLAANLQQFQDVTIRRVFLGEAPGKIEVCMDKAGWNNTLASAGTGSTQTVLLDTLDHALEHWPDLPNLRFIKCDTEGFDIRILLGGQATLADRKPVLLFEYNREAMAQTGESGFRIFSFLQKLNYNKILLYDAYGQFICATTLDQVDLLKDLHDYADGKHGKVYYYDMVVFSKNDDALAQSFLASERQHREAITAR